jgi:hypothetical protein
MRGRNEIITGPRSASWKVLEDLFLDQIVEGSADRAPVNAGRDFEKPGRDMRPRFRPAEVCERDGRQYLALVSGETRPRHRGEDVVRNLREPVEIFRQYTAPGLYLFNRFRL